MLEVLRRLPTLSEREREIVCRHADRLLPALREAVLGKDEELCRAACLAAVQFREYDMMPALLNVLEDPGNAHRELANKTLQELVTQLYRELASGGDGESRRDPRLVRRHVVDILALALERYPRHKCREVVEAFLVLVERENAALRNVLNNPYHPAFLAVVEVLAKSEQAGVARLLLGLLEDFQSPSAALAVIAKRCDPWFWKLLLKKIGREPSAAVVQNLKRIEDIAWLRMGEEMPLDSLDEIAQQGVVQLVLAANIPRTQALATLKRLLQHGQPAGRREAARALAEFNGAEANAMAMAALEDPDPHVQANVILHLRQRGIPGALTRIVDLLDSPHAVVQEACRQALAEFTFPRFLAAFDMLDEEVRRSTALLVKKVDPQALMLLGKELDSPVRAKRIRGLAIAQAMGAVEPLEEKIIALLEDEDHLIRARAAELLGSHGSPASRRALEVALADRSETVREAARQGLEQQATFAQWAYVLADPRD
jgi:HEAT repeat protein